MRRGKLSVMDMPQGADAHNGSAIATGITVTGTS